MAAKILSFFRPAEIPKDDWSSQEVAEFYRVEAALVQSGVRVSTDRGLSDEGDPWFVFCRDSDDEVIIHFARIDGQYVIAADTLAGVARGSDFRKLLGDVAAKHPMLIPAPHGGKLLLHPAALLAAVVATIFLHSSGTEAVASELGDGTEPEPEPSGTGTPHHAPTAGVEAEHDAAVVLAFEESLVDEAARQRQITVVASVILATFAAHAGTGSSLLRPIGGDESPLTLAGAVGNSSIAALNERENARHDPYSNREELLAAARQTANANGDSHSIQAPSVAGETETASSDADRAIVLKGAVLVNPLVPVPVLPPGAVGTAATALPVGLHADRAPETLVQQHKTGEAAAETSHQAVVQAVAEKISAQPEPSGGSTLDVPGVARTAVVLDIAPAPSAILDFGPSKAGLLLSADLASVSTKVAYVKLDGALGLFDVLKIALSTSPTIGNVGDWLGTLHAGSPNAAIASVTVDSAVTAEPDVAAVSDAATATSPPAGEGAATVPGVPQTQVVVKAPVQAAVHAPQAVTPTASHGDIKLASYDGTADLLVKAFLQSTPNVGVLSSSGNVILIDQDTSSYGKSTFAVKVWAMDDGSTLSIVGSIPEHHPFWV